MIPVHQTIFVDPDKPIEAQNGNCLAAAVASFLELPLDKVPNFAEPWLAQNHNWWWMLVGFMSGRGYNATILNDDEEPEPGEVVFVAGDSPRGPFKHQVLYQDGQLAHDPHPDGTGVLTVDDRIVWRRFA